MFLFVPSFRMSDQLESLVVDLRDNLKPITNITYIGISTKQLPFY